MNRMIGFLFGILYIDLLFHSSHAYAIELTATTTLQRLGALLFAGVATIIFYYFCRKFFPLSFFHGVIVASGFFASFDIVVIHWIFQLHRLTYGPEVYILEPLLVIIGILMFLYGIKKEREVIA
ncbi:hypothetical protein [Bacillus sp. FJAT-45350]|uniref:hypothetical protein n=1 Tax=Bacillus sp. FJAT-45350 TaxID=2011014 RepID=UPI000BB99E9B|nr:hypothetical protein [Bacillus sp. FJAT-45350]